VLSIARLTVVLLIGLAATAVRAQDYPTRPITIIVNSPPGGLLDPVARMIQTQVADALGQPIVIENRPGAAGNTATAAVARMAPDGYSVLMTNNAVLTTNKFLYKSLQFDPLKDFDTVTTAGKASLVIVVHKDVPIKNLAEYIAFAKAHPDEMTFGTAGFGSPFHIAGEFLKQRADIKMVHVPFSGGGPMAQALLGGHIKSAISTLSSMAPFLKEGNIRLIAVLDTKRLPEYPDVPTVGEAVPGIEATAWGGFVVPAGTPKPIVDRLYTVISKALKDNSEKLKFFGQEVMAETPAEMTDRIKREQAQWGEVIRVSGIEPQ
jgi:tripartite-type tricarboxylate transporter receptor subunit TctC